MNLKDIKLPPIHLILKRFFGRYHVVTFTIVIIGGLAVTTYLLNVVVTSASEATATGVETTVPGFDESTIERVNNLSESSGEGKTLDFPQNKRTNPFTE